MSKTEHALSRRDFLRLTTMTAAGALVVACVPAGQAPAGGGSAAPVGAGDAVTLTIFDFGGDASPVYRCRLTVRKTLACLIDVYGQGVEYKKLPVLQNQIYPGLF